MGEILSMLFRRPIPAESLLRAGLWAECREDSGRQGKRTWWSSGITTAVMRTDKGCVHLECSHLGTEVEQGMLPGGSSCLSKSMESICFGVQVGVFRQRLQLVQRPRDKRAPGFFREGTSAQGARRAECPGKWFYSSSRTQGCI